MTILAGMLLATAILYVLFLQIRELNELTRTRYRFRYFELRDRLAMLVATGKLKEKSWEYEHIIDTLNFHISAVERVSMMRLVEILAEYHLSTEEERKVRQMSKRLDDKEVAAIVVGYMATTYELIRRNSRAQLALVRGLNRLVQRTAGKDILKGPVEKVREPDRALSAIKSHQSAFEPVLAAA